MAIQDRFDSQFTENILKRTLISPSKEPEAANANDNNYELTKSDLVTLSNSFTSLQNAFNKIYAHTVNVRNIHQYDEKRMANISRQNSLENKINAVSAPATPVTDGNTNLASTTAALDTLAVSVEKLNEKMKRLALGSGENAPGAPGTMLVGDGINTRSRAGRIAGRALGAAGIGLDVFGRYQEGQSAGQIAAGVTGGVAGGVLGAKAGGALGALGGPLAPATVPLGAFIGGAIGYLGGSFAGDTTYDTLNKRAMGGPVRAGGTYLVGERGPEVLMLGGLSGKVIANGQRGRVSLAEENLNKAAEKSSRAAAKVIKGQPLGPTSYSTKFSNYLSSLFRNMPTWLDRIKDFLGIGAPGMPGILGAGQYAPVGDLSGVSGDWKNDTEFINAVNEVAQKYNFDANDLIGLMYHESAGTMSPSVRGKNGATGLFQFMPAFFDTDTIAQMSRAEQVRYADEKIFAANRLPQGANAGQLYAAVFLPGVAQNQNWQGVLSRRGDRYYGSNPSLDTNNDNQIDYGDLASVISGHRVTLGLGPSPSITGAMSTAGFASPVRGAMAISDRFGTRGGAHKGLDIPGNIGDPIMAVMGGRVVRAGDSGGAAGIRVNIQHDNGMETRYMHLSRVNVTEGQRVTQGQQIGEMGSTGRSSGPHLHLELLVGGRQVDVEPYLRGILPAATPTPEPARTRPLTQEEATNAAIRSLLGLPADGSRPSNQFNLIDPLAQFRSPTTTPNGTGGNSLRNYWSTTF